MILDEILEKKYDSPNQWIDLVLEYKNKSIFERYYKKYQLRKISERTTPTIEVINDMAETIQLFGRYLLYNNDKDTASIASYKKNKSNIIIFPIYPKEKDGLKCIIDINNKMTIKLSIITNDKEIQYNTSWNSESIDSVIKHQYDAYLFEKITNILMRRFFDLIIKYI